MAASATLSDEPEGARRRAPRPARHRRRAGHPLAGAQPRARARPARRPARARAGGAAPAHARPARRPRSRQRRLEGKRRRGDVKRARRRGRRPEGWSTEPEAPRYRKEGRDLRAVERVAYRHARPPRPRPARARRPARRARPTRGSSTSRTPSTAAPVVHTARDDGKERAPRRRRAARPTVSPDSRWIAYITVPAQQPRTARRSCSCRSAAARGGCCLRSRSVTDLRFSPDSALRRGHPARAPRARVRHRRGHHDRHRARAHPRLLLLARRRAARLRRGHGHVRRARRATSTSRRSTARWSAGASPPRATRSTRSGGRRRSSSTGSAAAAASRRPTTCGRRIPSGAAPPRRLTSLTIPPLFSGLVPLELSADGRRLLAVFTGQDAGVGFTVDARTGRTRALSRDVEGGLVGFDLSADGRDDPRPHRRPRPGPVARRRARCRYGGGEPTVLVEDAGVPGLEPLSVARAVSVAGASAGNDTSGAGSAARNSSFRGGQHVSGAQMAGGRRDGGRDRQRDHGGAGRGAARRGQQRPGCGGR